MLLTVRSTSKLAHVMNRSWFRGKSHPMITNMKAFLSLLFRYPRPLFFMSHSFTWTMIKVACSYSSSNSLAQEINSGWKHSLQLRSVAAWFLSLSFLCLLPSTLFVCSIAELKSTGQLTMANNLHSYMSKIWYPVVMQRTKRQCRWNATNFCVWGLGFWGWSEHFLN